MGWPRIFGSSRSSSREQSSRESTVRSQDSTYSTQRPDSRGALSGLSSYREHTSTRGPHYTPSEYGLSAHYQAPASEYSRYSDTSSYGGGRNRSRDSSELVSRLSALSVSSINGTADVSSRRVEQQAITEISELSSARYGFGAYAAGDDRPSHVGRQQQETEAARFEALRSELAPREWSAMLSQVNMSLLPPPDASVEPSHRELMTKRKEQREAMKADKTVASGTGFTQKQEELLRRVESSRNKQKSRMP